MKFRVDIRILKVVTGFLAAAAILMGGIFALHLIEDRIAGGTGYTEEDGRELTYFNGSWYALKSGVETILLMGIDKDLEDQSYEQSDFLMLLVLDKNEEHDTAIHINRDTMTEYRLLTDSGAVTGTRTGQITLAHAYGGDSATRCRNTVLAVSNLLYGIKGDHYISLMMDGVAALNDLAGGVALEILDDFTGIDDSLKKGETVMLLGKHALTYVRTRHGLEDSSNLRRMERQRQYLEALQTQLLSMSAANEDFIAMALTKINPYLVSDCSVTKLLDIVERMENSGTVQYVALEGEVVQGDRFMEFYVNEAALRELVMGLFYKQVENR